MTQDERWLLRYNEVLTFMKRERRNPSKHRIEEHDMLNWLKANRKLVNAGKMKEERVELFEKLVEMEEYDMPILYSCHPRSRKCLEASGFKLDKRVIQQELLGLHDYYRLQMNAFAVVSDSGTLPEDSSFFTSVRHPFPAVCIRTSTERPEALDKGRFFIAGIDAQSLLQTVDAAVTMNQNGDYGSLFQTTLKRMSRQRL